MRRFALLAIILALVATALGSGGAVAEGNVKDSVAPARHFAGVPPRGTHASMPTTGKLMLSFSLVPSPHLIWNVYADGRVIWQQWSSSGDPTVIPRGARGHRMLTLAAWPPGLASREHLTNATAAQEREVAQIRALLADTAAWSLPAAAWADRDVRAFVPSRYVFAFDRGVPDLTKLPSSLLPYRKLFSHGPNTCQIVTTGELRTVLGAFLQAGITPVSDHAEWIAFELEGLRGHPSGPHFSPVLPADSPC